MKLNDSDVSVDSNKDAKLNDNDVSVDSNKGYGNDVNRLHSVMVMIMT